MKRLLLCLLLCSCHPVPAWATELDVFALSYHFDRSEIRNEHNYGLGLGLPINNTVSIRLALYENSHYKTTAYVHIRTRLWHHKRQSLHLQAGATTGYNTHLGGIFVYTHKLSSRVTNNLFFIPTRNGGIAWGMSYRFE